MKLVIELKEIIKAVIPAAGMGTRLLPATKSQPKEMIPVGKKPVIQYAVEEAASAGIKQILIITGAKKRSIEDHFDFDYELDSILKSKNKKNLLEDINFMDKCCKDVQIFYTRQKSPLGLGHAIYLAKNFVDNEPFAVLLGDTIIHSLNSQNYLSRLINVYKEKNATAVIGVEEVDMRIIHKYGVIKVRDQNLDPSIIEGVVEKPMPQEAPSNLAINGRYIFSSKIFDYLRDLKAGKNNEIQLTDAIDKLIENNKKSIWNLKINKDEKRYDIGDFLLYARAFFDFSLRDDEIGKDFLNYVKEKIKEFD
ncbi:MAG: UTP--glucose-1-phosphate uridylyltransferase [Candidatus Lokiarchaeota archaeon]|nr:UTP--glucose-1-phosphate uridylyltransferase [Candidatus Lokiarchaeota archaeon]